MVERRTLGRVLIVAVVLWGQGCTPQPSEDLLAPTAAQMRLRSLQSRTFDVKDRPLAMRGVIGALQDLGFTIERADESLGLVTAARFAEPNFYDVVGVTVTVRQQAEGRFLIRVNAIYNNKLVDDPKVYQNFFATLERSLFVSRN
jgi:hypothetical protein